MGLEAVLADFVSTPTSPACVTGCWGAKLTHHTKGQTILYEMDIFLSLFLYFVAYSPLVWNQERGLPWTGLFVDSFFSADGGTRSSNGGGSDSTVATVGGDSGAARCWWQALQIKGKALLDSEESAESPAGERSARLL